MSNLEKLETVTERGVQEGKDLLREGRDAIFQTSSDCCL